VVLSAQRWQFRVSPGPGLSTHGCAAGAVVAMPPSGSWQTCSKSLQQSDVSRQLTSQKQVKLPNPTRSGVPQWPWHVANTVVKVVAVVVTVAVLVEVTVTTVVVVAVATVCGGGG